MWHNLKGRLHPHSDVDGPVYGLKGFTGRTVYADDDGREIRNVLESTKGCVAILYVEGESITVWALMPVLTAKLTMVVFENREQAWAAMGAFPRLFEGKRGVEAVWITDDFVDRVVRGEYKSIDS